MTFCSVLSLRAICFFTCISETVECLLTVTSVHVCVFNRGKQGSQKFNVCTYIAKKKKKAGWFREQCRHVFLNYCSCSLVRAVWHSIYSVLSSKECLWSRVYARRKKKPWNPNPFPQSSKRELDKQWTIAAKLAAGTMAATKKIKGLLTHSSYYQERFHIVLIIPQKMLKVKKVLR